ncbi:helix-turn-helix domain-containing protein [Streptomyces djakartensis]|uniref:Uncharacterized protein n=1 Tax=Streptomyces djakartensis TaxID=68193 RepID=A0ABQ3AI72_9ACTN|nr:hypothetical protein [Streptomyces djakartensis]GGY50871.1 hypothetical protein GCM10010384_66050 [Streptomyces djakartensis]
MSGLDPLGDDIRPEVRELAETLRMLFASLEISLRRYAVRAHSDPGTVSRYLNGKRVPPWSFVTGLLTHVADHRGEPVTAEARSSLRMLHGKAVAASTRNHRVQELQQLLQEQDQHVRDSQAGEQRLEEELLKLQRRFHVVETELRALEAARASDCEEHRGAMDQARAEQARLRAERDSLRQEITSLRTQLADAQQATTLAEEHCARLERLLDAAEHGSPQPPQPARASQHPVQDPSQKSGSSALPLSSPSPDVNGSLIGSLVKAGIGIPLTSAVPAVAGVGGVSFSQLLPVPNPASLALVFCSVLVSTAIFCCLLAVPGLGMLVSLVRADRRDRIPRLLTRLLLGACVLTFVLGSIDPAWLGPLGDWARALDTAKASSDSFCVLGPYKYWC